MKTDPRTRYTKSLIQNTFIALLHDKQASRITVSEICAKAEINRGTFYRYYLDVFDLMDQMMEESLKQIDEMINSKSGESFEHTFSNALQVIRDDPKLFYMSVSGSVHPEGDHSFLEKLFQRCYEGFGKNMISSSPDENARLLSFVSGGSAAMIACWLRTGSKESPEEMAALISEYCGHIVRAENKKALSKKS
uniref:Transcriptional regulator, TetR family n=1 Tax=uncultured bacterium Contig16 TaxID=1393468 RepID=W0FKL8_9BACT|nr:transcriptional regulator, TetR family [uncultured bacterium Contig16]